MPKNASEMCDHRRNRHPQLFSPARDPFPPPRRRSGREGAPSPPRSPGFPGFYRALPSSAFGHPSPASPDASSDHGEAPPIPWRPGALPSRREDPIFSLRPRRLQAPGRDTRQPRSGRDAIPGIFTSIERDPSARSASPSPSARGGSSTSCSSPAPHPSEPLASRSYSHDGTISPLGPRPRRLETPRYVSAPRPLPTPPASGALGVPHGPLTILLPSTPPPPPRRRRPAPSPLSPGFGLGRRARGSGPRAWVCAPESPRIAASMLHRPRCPCCGCGCGCGSVGNRSRRSGGCAGAAGPTA
ncbi:hypothetical protein LX36DRAFT_720762 [Colletotrichum falcatum]|nr:hypothetical protein LX36DRAFT_720762 [Colletotrichum falcatum]